MDNTQRASAEIGRFVMCSRGPVITHLASFGNSRVFALRHADCSEVYALGQPIGRSG
jgi:hypothetical protein